MLIQLYTITKHVEQSLELSRIVLCTKCAHFIIVIIVLWMLDVFTSK